MHPLLAYLHYCFNHLYSDMVDICGFPGRVNLYAADNCEGWLL